MSISVVVGTAVLLACLFLLANESKAGGGVLCVVPPGEPTGPFAACAAVFTQIQDAVDTAVGGEEIWVATGVYTDVHERDGLRQMVYLNKALILRGGYIPPFDTLPDPLVNLTVLDAGRQGRVMFITDTAVTVSNFHITGGDATGLEPATWNDLGGGLYAANARLTLNDNVVYSNTASLSYGAGGGVAIQDGVVTMTKNVIRDNIAGYMGNGAGGGILIQRSSFYLANNTVLSNTAVFTNDKSSPYSTLGFGGGLAIGASQGEIVDNHIEGNVALHYGYRGMGGGIYLEHGSQVTQSYHVLIAGNQIHRNIGAIYPEGTGDGEGGGIFVHGLYQNSVPPLHTALIDNVIQENIATVSGTFSLAGGIAVLHNTILTFTHNTIISNTGLISGGTGLIGGLVTSNVTGTLAYNRFIGNVAAKSAATGSAGGLYFYESQIEQRHDFIQGNVANQSGEGTGGGIFFEGGDAILTNVIVTDNRADTEGAALWLGSADVTLFHPTLARNLGDNAIYLTTGFDSSGPSEMILTNGLLSSHPVGIVVTGFSRATIQGILWHDTPIAISASPSAIVTVEHQVTGDPLFAPDGYHITAGSAAIRAGVPAGVTLDIDGEGRPSANPSLGADEYWPFKRYFPVVFRE
ncbi:MAG TPA: hypothetical protein PLD25_28060 [Chloroflexota bacterium]|nr:hypothetical protein [Chloroflexota bacterium]